MDILEIILGCRSDPFTLIDLELPTNFYMIACTDIRNFEEGENCASTISVEKNIGSDMILFGSDLIFLGSKFQVHRPSVLLVVVLINDVKKQVPQVSYKIVAGDLISFHSFGSVVNLFRFYLLYYIVWFIF